MQAGERTASASADLGAIKRLVDKTRFRVRSQWAFEGAVTATVFAAAASAATVFAMRLGAISKAAGTALLLGAVGVVVLGALLKGFRRLDDEAVARRIDRASNLSDRLSTAIAFKRTFAAGLADEDEETREMMEAAIRDGVRAVPRADVKAAAPYSAPSDLGAAIAFVVVSALIAGLAIPSAERSPVFYGVDPTFGAPGTEVTIHGGNLLAGVAIPVAMAPASSSLGAPGAPAATATPTARPAGFVPEGATIFMSTEQGGRPVQILDWSMTAVKVKIPADAPLGPTQLTAHVNGNKLGPVTFTVVDPRDERYHKENAVLLDPDERAYVEAILAELRFLAKKEHIEELEKFADTIEQLLKDAEEGKITKEQLLEALAKAEELLNQGKEPDQAQIDQQLSELGKELSKEKLTEELGKALQQNDLEKAEEELEKLAAKLDPSEKEEQMKQLEEQLKDPSLSEEEKKDLQKKLDELKKQQPMTEKEKEKLQEKLEQAANKMAEQQKKQQDKQDQAKQKLQEEMKRLQKQKEEAKTEEEKLNAERQLQKKQDELKKLEKDEQDKQQSAQRESVKRLQRDLEKAAESLEKPKDKQESQEEQQEREKQASQKLKDAARETGRVDQDKRKQASQKKLSSQMDDLREAMRRAKQKSNKGPQDRLKKQNQQQDYAERSRGKKGNGGQSWKPGQGNQPGQGGQGGQGNQPGGQGNQPGGNSWGTGHEEDMTGDATAKSGNQKDEDLQGKSGKDGGSTRETILSAAQKGFASKRYQKVYADYQRIVEEVMRTEKLPSSYKYYVKRYFAKIHPSGAPEEVKESPKP